MDVPVDHADRVYLIERHVDSDAELQGVVDAYAAHSEAAGVPAILATLRTARTLPTPNVEEPLSRCSSPGGRGD